MKYWAELAHDIYNEGADPPAPLLAATREVYVRALNVFLAKYGSKTRVVARDPPCRIVAIHRKYFEPATMCDGMARADWLDKDSRWVPPPPDAAYQQALEAAFDADLDDYVEFEVRIAHDFDDFLKEVGKVPR